MKIKTTGLVKASAIAIAMLGCTAIVGAFTFPDAAYAKEGKGNGGGKGKGGGNGNGGDKGNSGSKGHGDGSGTSSGKGKNKGNGSAASKNGGTKTAGKSGHKSKGSAGGTSKSSKKGQFSLKGLLGGNKKQTANKKQRKGINGLFQGNKPVTSAARTKKTSVKQSLRPPSRKKTIIGESTLALEPRNLGKLNGAINSSPKAKLAHIANGQYMKGTGPVSLAAGLAVADANFNHIMGEDNTLSPKDVKEINAALDYLDEAPLSVEEAEDVLANEEANPGTTDPDVLADAQAVADAHDLTTDEDGNPIDRPTEDQVAAAEAVHQAEADILGHHKGGFSEDDAIATKQQDSVLGAVRASNPDDEAVKNALGVSYHEDNNEDDEDEASTDPVGENQTPDGEQEEELANSG